MTEKLFDNSALLEFEATVTLVRAVHHAKVWGAISVTLSGRKIEVRALLLWKAYSPMEVTLSGIITDSSFAHFENAFAPMVLTFLPMVMLVILVFP